MRQGLECGMYTLLIMCTKVMLFSLIHSNRTHTMILVVNLAQISPACSKGVGAIGHMRAPPPPVSVYVRARRIKVSACR